MVWEKTTLIWEVMNTSFRKSIWDTQILLKFMRETGPWQNFWEQSSYKKPPENDISSVFTFSNNMLAIAISSWCQGKPFLFPDLRKMIWVLQYFVLPYQKRMKLKKNNIHSNHTVFETIPRFIQTVTNDIPLGIQPLMSLIVIWPITHTLEN